jgi:hypothetical protein
MFSHRFRRRDPGRNLQRADATMINSKSPHETGTLIGADGPVHDPVRPYSRPKNCSSFGMVMKGQVAE